MSKAKTLHVGIRLVTDDTATVSMRWGNLWNRARIRQEGGWTPDDIMALGRDTGFLAGKIREARARGEFWTKDGMRAPWVQAPVEKASEGGAE